VKIHIESYKVKREAAITEWKKHLLKSDIKYNELKGVDIWYSEKDRVWRLAAEYGKA